MSEKLSSHAPEQHTPKEQPALPPAIQNVKDLLDQDVLNILVSAYEGLSDTGKTALLRSVVENQEKMGRFLEDPAGMKALMGDIVKWVKVLEVDKKVWEKTELKWETNKKAWEKEEKKQENIQKVWEEKSHKKELLKQAREQLTATYALFGGKDGFESKFPKHTEWKQEATARVQREAKKTGKELTPDELATRVETSMIVSHGEEIKASLASDPAKQKEFASHMGELRASAEALDIPYETTIVHDPVSKATEKVIAAELVGLEPGDKVIRTGSEVRYGDQVVDMSKVPPVRYFEKDGLRAEITGTKEIQGPEEVARLSNIQSEKSVLEKNISNDTAKLEALAKNLPSPVKLDQSDPKKFRSQAQELRRSLIADAEAQHKKGELENEDDKKVVRQRIEQLGEKEINAVAEKIERLDDINTEIAELAEHEKASIAKYQESLKEKDAFASENLRMFSESHLGELLKQQGVSDFLQFINEQVPDPHLSLGSKWGYSEKSLVARYANKISWAEIFHDNGAEVTVSKTVPETQDQPIDAQYIRGLLEKSGIYGGNPPEVSREKLRKAILPETQNEEWKEGGEDEKGADESAE